MTNTKSQKPLYEQVVNTLRDQIVSGVYRKGDLLPSEKDLIDSMGVSRITVRKALSILAESGLIETSKGRGSVVVFDVDDQGMRDEFSEELKEYRRVFEESTQIRLMLEPEVARQAAKTINDEQIEFLKQCYDARSEQDLRHDFHRAIVSVLNNQELDSMMDQLIRVEESKAPVGVILPEKQEKMSKILNAQHKRVLDAIIAGDDEFAYYYMKEHTRYVMRMYEELFERVDRKK